MTNKEKQAYLEYLQEYCQARGYYRERAKEYYQAGNREAGEVLTMDVREMSREIQTIKEVGERMGITWDVISSAIDAAEAKGENIAYDTREVTYNAK